MIILVFIVTLDFLTPVFQYQISTIILALFAPVVSKRLNLFLWVYAILDDFYLTTRILPGMLPVYYGFVRDGVLLDSGRIIVFYFYLGMSAFTFFQIWLCSQLFKKIGLHDRIKKIWF